MGGLSFLELALLVALLSNPEEGNGVRKFYIWSYALPHTLQQLLLILGNIIYFMLFPPLYRTGKSTRATKRRAASTPSSPPSPAIRGICLVLYYNFYKFSTLIHFYFSRTCPNDFPSLTTRVTFFKNGLMRHAKIQFLGIIRFW